MKVSAKRTLCIIMVIAMLMCTTPLAFAEVDAQNGMNVLKKISASSDVLVSPVTAETPSESF